MFTAAVFTIARRWKRPRADHREWINQVWLVRAMGYYAAFKRKESLTQATPWMKPEDMLSKANQRSEIMDSVGFHLYKVHSQIYRDRK